MKNKKAPLLRAGLRFLLPSFARPDSRGRLSLHGSCWPL